MRRLYLGSLQLILAAGIASAGEVYFSTNFDQHEDWYPKGCPGTDQSICKYSGQCQECWTHPFLDRNCPDCRGAADHWLPYQSKGTNALTIREVADGDKAVVARHPGTSHLPWHDFDRTDIKDMCLSFIISGTPLPGRGNDDDRKIGRAGLRWDGNGHPISFNNRRVNSNPYHNASTAAQLTIDAQNDLRQAWRCENPHYWCNGSQYENTSTRLSVDLWDGEPHIMTTCSTIGSVGGRDGSITTHVDEWRVAATSAQFQQSRESWFNGFNIGGNTKGSAAGDVRYHAVVAADNRVTAEDELHRIHTWERVGICSRIERDGDTFYKIGRGCPGS